MINLISILVYYLIICIFMVEGIKLGRRRTNMTLSIKRPETEQLAHAIAKQTGETLTEAVTKALEERLLRIQGKKAPIELQDTILKIAHRCAKLPNRDNRSPDEILGYDDFGIPS
jgi:antitoxin VapB